MFEALQVKERSEKRWLLGWIVVDLASAFLYASNDPSEYDFGASVVDVSLMSLIRCLFVLLTLVSVACFKTRKHARTEMGFAFGVIALCMGCWTYIFIKLCCRLVEEGPFILSNEWFWSCLLLQAVFISCETSRVLGYLSTHLIYRVEGNQIGAFVSAETLSDELLGQVVDGGDAYVMLTPRQKRHKEKAERELFGNKFDWFVGKINGKDAEDESGKEEEVQFDADGNVKKVPESSVSKTLIELFKLISPFWIMMSFAVVALILAAIGNAFLPLLTGNIIENVKEDAKNIALLRSSVGKLLFAGVFTAIFSALRGSCFTVAKGLINITLRHRLFEALLNQDIGFFDKSQSGKLSSRLNTDTTMLADQCSLSFNVFSRSMVQAFCVLVFMFRLNVELSLATFATVPVVAAVTELYGRLVFHLQKEGQMRLAAANGISDAALSTMHNVRCFASEKAETKRYKDGLDLYMTLQVRSGILYVFYAIIFTFLPCMATAIVLYYGGKLASEDQIKTGDLVSFMLYQQSLSQAINDIGQVFSDIAGAMGAGDKVFQLINREPVKRFKEGTRKPEEFTGSIEFKNVRFKYPARPLQPILNSISLSIKPGQTVALTGQSGGGKSSILKLIERLYEPESGEILLSGIPIQDFDHQYLHQKISIVGQEPVLYARTIAENIKYGLEGTPQEPTMDDIIEAAKNANAHDFIMGFPEQYETIVGDRGVSLSGGQKQRIAIARSLVRNSEILLLDEATSALDSASEQMVQATLDQIMAQGTRTIITVAHRLSTISGADVIIAMGNPNGDGGEIIEMGNHQELMSQNGLYYDLVQKQTKGL